MEVNLWKIRLVLWGILGAVVLALLWLGVVPSGKITYVNNFEKNNEFIQKLTPIERIEPISNGSQKIIGDPVYFSLRTPRKFEQAKFTIKYKNKSNFPIIEIGPLMDKVLWQYNLEPIENKIINNLFKSWKIIQEGNLMFLQRDNLNATSTFYSITDFLNNLPEQKYIALYNYELDNNYLISDYEKSDQEKNIDYSLRGNFSFYTYIKNEDLSFEFKILDLNKNKDSDPVTVNLYYKNELIDSWELANDGIAVDNKEILPARDLGIKSVNLPEGVYKIELKANDDIVTQNIKTRQKKISFINKIWLHDDNGENIKLFSDSKKIGVQTVNPASLQNIKIDDEDLEIEETFKLFSQDFSFGLKEIVLAKDDVIISGDGVFGFSGADLLNPSFKRVDSSLDVDGEGVDYILARYQVPQTEGDWQIAQVDLDISNAYREFNKNSILISIPGLRADDDIDDYVEIDEISVELGGRSLWNKIKNLLISS